MRVLIIREFSGVVQEVSGPALRRMVLRPVAGLGDGSPHHFQEDIRKVLSGAWDMMIAHPPCTQIPSLLGGARWFKDKLPEQAEALELVRRLLNAPVPARRIGKSGQYHFIAGSATGSDHSAV